MQKHLVSRMDLFSEYKNSLKVSAGEEFFDLAIHRPLGYVVVKLIQPLPISPNQVTGFSVIVSLAAAYCIATNSSLNIAIAGFLILLGNILDCADGQLARLRGTCSQYGRIIDGAADYISFISIFIAIAMWRPPEEVSPHIWMILVAVSLMMFGWQSSLVDYYRNEFSCRLSGKINFARREFRQTTQDLTQADLAEWNSFYRFILRSYASYLAVQRKSRKSTDELDHVSPSTYVKANSMLVRLWCLNGSATPRFLMAVFCFFDRLDLLIAYVLIVGMAWTIVLLAVQIRVDKILRRGTP